MLSQKELMTHKYATDALFVPSNETAVGAARLAVDKIEPGGHYQSLHSFEHHKHRHTRAVYGPRERYHGGKPHGRPPATSQEYGFHSHDDKLVKPKYPVSQSPMTKH